MTAFGSKRPDQVDCGGRPFVVAAAASISGAKVQDVQDKALQAPRGLLFKLAENGGTLFDEDAIGQYLLEDTKSKLADDVLSKARSQQWLVWNRTKLQPALAAGQAAILAEIEKQLSASAFLAGQQPTLADLAVVGTLIANKQKQLSAPVSKWKGSVEALLKEHSHEAKATTVIPAPKDAFFITTAINYTNGAPHMGHAYEAVIADVLARYHRACGRNVYFMTGTDEHGQKIANAAEARGITPLELCNQYSGQFQTLNKRLNIASDFFVRTTMAEHKKTCHWLFTKALEAGDIYLGTYEGWYNIREETFVTESEAKRTEYKDEVSGAPLKKQNESSYFFKMSKYQERLRAHIQANPAFIQPDIRRNEILARLEEPLQDLSISRTTFAWGIPLPNDPRHVMYVWFDALTNYLTGVGYPDGPLSSMWPPQVQLVGKDITWFHTVIWPTMLMSVGVPLPLTVFAHGFVMDEQGRKMSKTVGNVVDPNDVLDRCSADTFRYYLMRESSLGSDLPFSERSLATMHNADLADTLGNLVHRAVNLCHKYCAGAIPNVPSEQPFDIAKLREQTEQSISQLSIRAAVETAMDCVRDTNLYITERAPWQTKDETKRAVAVRTTLEAVYVFAVFLAPYMPTTAATLFDKLHTKPRLIKDLSVGFDNLAPGTPVDVGDILFVKVTVPESNIPSAAATPAETLSSEQLEAAVTEQANKVRKLKEAKADPDLIKLEVENLKSLKARLAAVNPLAAAAASPTKDAKAKADKPAADKAKPAAAPAAEKVKAEKPAKADKADKAPAPAKEGAKEGAAEAKAGKAEKKEKEKKPAEEKKDKAAEGGDAHGAAAADEALTPEAAATLYASVDVRVGVIVDAWEHGSSEKLWCEKIDVGEGAPREIGSGLRAYYKKDQMVGARVLVICNLKPIKLGGFPSNGMVLCTKGADGSVEFLQPPEDAKPGDRLLLAGVEGQVASSSQMQKHKIFERVAPVLKTDASGVASVAGKVLTVNGKPCKTSRAANAPIS